MSRRWKLLPLFLVLGTSLLPAANARAADKASQDAAIALDSKLIGFRSVEGPDNQTPALAAYLKQLLVAGGYADGDVEITPMDTTAYLVARYRGTDPSAKPLVISGHMDVVAADPKDWDRDPFTAVIENGFIYGRGATDMKTDLALVVTTLLEMKKAGVKPKRDIILAVSGDEETEMATSARLAALLKGAELALNIDGGGGLLGPDGKPMFLSVDGAEKTYADFRLTVTNPGGHSSVPGPSNAIYQLSAALVRIGQYQFAPMLNPITKAWLEGAAGRQPGDIAAAMRAYAADPTDKAAIATLRTRPPLAAQIATTCVATMLSGGHALNALPQRATANINCRIFPGVKPADVMAILNEVADDPAVKIEDVTQGSVPSDASPLRPDLMKAIRKALDLHYKGVPILPAMSTGASDSMWFRNAGVPSYGVSPVFLKSSDNFSHGLNERTPVANFGPGLDYYRSLITDLSK